MVTAKHILEGINIHGCVKMKVSIYSPYLLCEMYMYIE